MSATLFISPRSIWPARNGKPGSPARPPEGQQQSADRVAGARSGVQAGAERKYGIALNSTGGAGSKYEPQKSPFDVLEEDAAKREAAEKAQHAGTGDARVHQIRQRPPGLRRLLPVPGRNPHLSSETGTLKLRTADYKSLLLIGADDFSCDWRNLQVTVNYKPGKGPEGDLVSLEMR